MSEGGEGGDCAEQPRQITRRTRNARRNIINRNHLSMSKRLIISWLEGCLCGHSSCMGRPCRPVADSSFTASAPESGGGLRSLCSAHLAGYGVRDGAHRPL